MDRSYLFRLRADAQQLVTTAESAAQAVDRLAGTTEGLARDQAAARAAGDRFIANLQRQVTEAGRTASELLRMRAAEMGVADAARPLIDALDEQVKAQQRASDAAARAAAGQRALENIRAAAARQERDAYQTQQQFIDGLQREAAAIGKTRSELLEMRAAQLGVTTQAAPLIQRLQAADRATAGLGKTGKLSAQELQQVAFQLNDFGVQVASGQNAIVALIQQGSQLSGTFGGVGNSVRALTSLITPARVGLFSIVAAIGAQAVAAAKGYIEQREFEKSLAATGNRAGQTADSVTALAEDIAASSQLTVRESRSIVQVLISTGQVGPQALGAVAHAAAALADVTGRSAEEVVREFDGMSRGVARWAEDANRRYNFLTAEQLRYIKSLEAQGKTEEATAVAARTLTATIAARKPELGLLERAWDGITKAASTAWQAMLNVGKTDTVSKQLQDLRDMLALEQERLQFAQDGRGTQTEIEGRKSAIESIQAKIEARREQQRTEEQAARDAAASAVESQKAIEQSSAGYQSALAAITKAGIDRRRQDAEAAYEADLRGLERSHTEQLISARGYVVARAHIEREAIAAKEQAVAAEIALLKKQADAKGISPDVLTKPPTGASEEVLRLNAQYLELTNRLAGFRAERQRLADDIRSGKLDPKPREVQETPQADFRRQELEQTQAVQEAYAERALAARQNARDLVLTNAGLSRELIRDERARGEAIIAAEAEELRKRLDLGALAGKERKEAEDSVAAYIALRNRQLTEQLKPEWQRLVDEWRDTNRLMRETSDRFQAEFLRTSEDTFVQFLKKGKLSFDELGDLAIEESGRFLFRQNFAPTVAQAGNAIARGLGFGGGTPAAAGDAGGLIAQQAQTQAVVQSTVALQAFTGALGGTATVNTASADAMQQVTDNAAGLNQQFGGLIGIIAQAGQALISFIASAGSAAGGGGGTNGILGAIGSFVGSYFGTPGSINTDAQTLPTGDFARMDRLAYTSGLALGGSKPPGTVQEVAEGGRPELYRKGDKTYLLDPDAGYVTPAAPISAAELRGAVPGTAGAPNVALSVEIVNHGTPQREKGREMTPDGRLRILVEDIVADSIANGGKVDRAMQQYGANRAAGLTY